jgi:putative ABC transport system substrate-binding protein
MFEIIKERERAGFIWAFGLLLSLMIFGGCKESDKVFTVGILNSVSIHEPCLNGFKAGMAEFGYLEGENIKYIYSGPVDAKQEIIDAEIKNLLSQHIDLLFTAGNEVTLRAKKILKGTGIPIVIGTCNTAIEQGIVESLTHPGDNITGVQAVNTIIKGLEWLAIIKPGTKKVYLPYNPDDIISASNLAYLLKGNSKLGIEIVVQKVHSVEETTAAIQNLPEGIDAVYRIPSPTLDPRNSELCLAATRRGIAMGSCLSLNEDVLVTYSSDFYDMGKQAARLVNQIYLGAKPGDLPVETSGAFLVINLKTAEKIGLNVPDDALMQAKRIIR